jgi:hypothetical protein
MGVDRLLAPDLGRGGAAQVQLEIVRVLRVYDVVVGRGLVVIERADVRIRVSRVRVVDAHGAASRWDGWRGRPGSRTPHAVATPAGRHAGIRSGPRRLSLLVARPSGCVQASRDTDYGPGA